MKAFWYEFYIRRKSCKYYVASFPARIGISLVPASEAFVFEEEMELYLFAIKSTFDMAPLADRASLLGGSAD
jgi:hypothetical protein